mmetsp:Transcript_101025/g.261610  ORF Transcript_101025/g.261610 Transcript_101025/m.261610 type:complete len:149 (+) Transcript_101025:102-548(+)
MDTPLGTALCTVSTSNQWSVLDAVLKKVNKKLSADHQASAAALLAFMDEIGDEGLKSHGIWRQRVGNTTIVCTNLSYARARRENAAAGRVEGACSCKMAADNSAQRYFGSHDYNGGRHASTQSKHHGSCLLWQPAPSGHLHSWRRGYD